MKDRTGKSFNTDIDISSIQFSVLSQMPSQNFILHEREELLNLHFMKEGEGQNMNNPNDMFLIRKQYDIK